MIIKEETTDALKTLLYETALNDITPDGNPYKELCDSLNVVKMYYDMNLGEEGRYRDQRTGKIVFNTEEVDNKFILYDSGKKSGFTMKFDYYYNGFEYVHAYIEFEESIRPEDVDRDYYQFFADVVYLLASRHNMKSMLEHAELSDPLTDIPNVICVRYAYERMIKLIPPSEIAVICMNLKNFQYINDTVGAGVGDEVIRIYSRKLVNLVEENEIAGRIGGDSFIVCINKNNLDPFLKKTENIVISSLQSSPHSRFEVGARFGISLLNKNEDKPFHERMNDANVALGIGKNYARESVMYYNDDLKKRLMLSHDVISSFPFAIKNHEFVPYFQPKVNMKTGKLAGFEALCRWFHEGSLIFPDQFIPILDREGLIPELDLAIFEETCRSVKKWKDMGLNPPRISSNFSKKCLFVPDIEKKIFEIISDNSLEAREIEIEITESIKDHEYNRLIDFVKILKKPGLFISIDDFGTGYSSLSLLYNIDADIIKIDKSFTDKITEDPKASILIENVITIANQLNIHTIAEGVETSAQGKKLLNMGCDYAQGYYYSKPVDFDTATEMIRSCPFKPMEQD
ncbi:MAG: bifunctional diguanylate cyclase/phosphodiesterase [Lachnospiraceae bacterium]|nr:bifunctional diguanylate cyclase/phosphodiesterase [Lachnospiraceae bacterium]